MDAALEHSRTLLCSARCVGGVRAGLASKAPLAAWRRKCRPQRGGILGGACAIAAHLGCVGPEFGVNLPQGAAAGLQDQLAHNGGIAQSGAPALEPAHAGGHVPEPVLVPHGVDQALEQAALCGHSGARVALKPQARRQAVAKVQHARRGQQRRVAEWVGGLDGPKKVSAGLLQVVPG